MSIGMELLNEDRLPLVYMGLIVGWIEGNRVLLTDEAPSFYEDEYLYAGYSITRV